MVHDVRARHAGREPPAPRGAGCGAATSTARDAQRRAWAFLRPFVNQFDAAIFSLPEVHPAAEHPPLRRRAVDRPAVGQEPRHAAARGGRDPPQPRRPSGPAVPAAGRRRSRRPRIPWAWSTPTGWSRSTTTSGWCWPAPAAASARAVETLAELREAASHDGDIVVLELPPDAASADQRAAACGDHRAPEIGARGLRAGRRRGDVEGQAGGRPASRAGSASRSSTTSPATPCIRSRAPRSGCATC